MKRKVFFLLVMLSLASMTYAHSFSAVCSTGQWLYYNINGTNVTVTYPGNSGGYDGYTRPTGNLEIPSSVNYNDITYSVTSIGSAAFSGCSGLTSVTIPSSVTSIGQAAFSGCSGLTGTLTIPNSVTSIGAYAFYGCSGLTGTLTIPNSVTSIEHYAFYGCSGLTGPLTIPNSVTSIGDEAFAWCRGLTSVTIPNSVTSIGEDAFYFVKIVVYDGPIAGCPWGGQTCNGYIEDSLIYSDASKTVVTGCVLGLRNAIIPNSVTSIGDYAFYNCSGLTSVTIPNSVTSIGDLAFANCSNLTTLNYNAANCGGDGFCYSRYNYDYHYWENHYGSWLFGCTSLTTLNIGSDVIQIPAYAFYDRSSLTSITVPNSVESIGQNCFYNCNIRKLNYNGPSTYLHQDYFGCVDTLIIGNTVEAIPEHAFLNCSNLTSVTVGRSVTNIGVQAFSGCPNLTSVNYRADNCVNFSNSAIFGTALTSLSIGNYVQDIPDRAFMNCSGLTRITIPNSVTSIGEFAFYGCTGLTSVTIPNSVTSIGGSAFSGCSGLTGTLTIPNTVTSIGTSAFNGCSGLTGTLTIPNSVTSISYAAFANCSGLTSVTIPNSVTSIEHYAFSGCSGLTSVIIPNSMTSIEEGTFSGCTGLTSVTIPNSVTNIGNEAFSGCSGLTSFTIPNLVTSIADNTFYGCSSLTNLTIPNSVTSIGYGAFSDCTGLTSVTIPNSVTSIGQNAFQNCASLTNVTIPNNVASIGQNAFRDCTGLTSVTIGRSVNQIGTSAFSGCPNLAIVVYRAESCVNQSYSALFGTALTSLSFGNYVRVIPDYAFSDCSELTSVTIPNSVTRIGGAAFQNCSGLTSVAIGNSVTIIDGGAFYGCSGLTGTLTIPNSVTEIGYNAFSGCSGLNAVTIGKSVTRIQGTFVGCTSLSTVNFNAENCRNVTEGVFQNLTRLTTLNIGNEVQYIPTNMFNGCTGLVNLNIPDAVEEIGTGAFAGCSNLTSATIGNGVATIGSNAFANCTRLTSVSLGSSVETIGNSAFSNCGIIGELVVPQSVISIGDAGFYHCYGISEITCLGRVAPTLGTDAFEGVVSSIPVNVPCGTTNIYAGRWPYFSNFNSTPFVFHVASADLAMGTVSMTQSPSCNDPVAIVVATPRSGYQFDHWSDGSTANPYTYTAMGSLTLTAYFTSNSPSQYTLTVTANDVSMGSVMGGGSYAAGSTATLAAIPRAGYHFTQWNDGNTDNPRTVTVTGNATYTAQFAANTSNYTITATTNDPTMGSVAGGGSYASGASVTLTAVAAPCHHFVAWSNGATTASITFTVTQDDALTATFVRDADQHSYTEVTHCGPYTWAVNGRTYNQSGIKTYRNTSAAGCVSRDTLSLTVVSRWTSHEYVTNCGPYTWNVNGRTYNQSGNKTYRSTAADGCPKYDTLTLTVVNRWTSHEYVTNCGPYTWDVNGRTYNQSGNKTYRSTAVDGCPKYDTLTLTVVNRWTSHEYVTNCGPYTWNVNGRTYNQSGTKTYRSTADDGCPKYDTLTLTVVSRWSNHEYVTNCGPYTWDVNGRTYNQSGTKTYRSTAADGCPKYDTLTLVVGHDQSSHVYVTNCGPYTWAANGRTYNQSGTKTYKGTTPEGCVSRDTLTLTINNCGKNPETNSQLSTLNSQLSIYPNPTTGMVHIDATEVDRVEVMDLVGRRVALFENTNTLDLSNLAQGTYTLRVTMPDGVAIRKVVKK